MDISNLLIYGNKKLRKVSSPVTDFTDDKVKLAKEMLELMYKFHGVGLAAPQIGVFERIIVVDTDYINGAKNPITMINPEIIEFSDEQVIDKEGCLSIPGIYSDVTRSDKIKVKYLDLDFKEQTLYTSGYNSRCIQHEVNHLDGILFVDKVSNTDKVLIQSKLKKISKYEKRQFR